MPKLIKIIMRTPVKKGKEKKRTRKINIKRKKGKKKRKIKYLIKE